MLFYMLIIDIVISLPMVIFATTTAAIIVTTVNSIKLSDLKPLR